jgi:hypothetical protein
MINFSKESEQNTTKLKSIIYKKVDESTEFNLRYLTLPSFLAFDSILFYDA